MYKNKLVQLIKKTKVNYYRRQINKKKKNSSEQLWQTVNSLCNKNHRNKN